MSCSSEMHHSSSTHRYIRSTFQPAAFCWMPAFDRSVWNHETSVFFKAETWKKNTHSRWRKEKGEHDTMESILVCVRFLFNQSAHGFYWVEGKFIGLALAGPPLQPTFVKTTLARQRHRQIHFNRKPSKNCSAQTKTDTTSCFDRVPWRDRCQRRSPGLKGAAWGAAWGWRQPNTFLLDSRHSLTWSL